MPSRALSYSVYGRKENPALLCLHGFLGCKEDWQEVASALVSDYCVIAVDLPGHGKSVDGLTEDDYTMPGCSTLLIELLDSLEIDHCCVLGYSMGGRLALYSAVHAPNCCNALILESASPGLRTEQERAARRESDAALADRLLTEPLEQFLKTWYDQPLFSSLRQRNRFAQQLKRRQRNNPHGLALSLRQMGTGSQATMWPHLKSLDIPVLLLAGQLDQKFARIAEEMASELPCARLRLIENAGHTLHFEATERYIAEVRQFLNERK